MLHNLNAGVSMEYRMIERVVFTPLFSPVLKLVSKPVEGPPKSDPVKMLEIWLICPCGQAPGEITRCHITQRTMGTKLIIVSSPYLQFTPCILD